MNNRAKKYLFVFLFIALLVFVWFIRETLFVYTNSQIAVLEFGNEPFKFFPGMEFLGRMELSSLQNFKWIMTFVFFIMFWSFSVLCIYLFYSDKMLYRYVHVTYAVTLLIAGASILLGKLGGENVSQQAYSLSRLLMGSGQSPLLLMILLPVFKLAKKSY